MSIVLGLQSIVEESKAVLWELLSTVEELMSIVLGLQSIVEESKAVLWELLSTVEELMSMGNLD